MASNSNSRKIKSTFSFFPISIYSNFACKLWLNFLFFYLFTHRSAVHANHVESVRSLKANCSTILPSTLYSAEKVFVIFRFECILVLYEEKKCYMWKESCGCWLNKLIRYENVDDHTGKAFWHILLNLGV